MKFHIVLAALVIAPIFAVSPAFAQADPAAGKIAFTQKCSFCHTLSTDPAHGPKGPNLIGVIGRTAGTIAGWEFTPALKASNLVLTEETLIKWLTDPEALVPGTTMTVKVPNKFDREDLIAYMKSVSPAK
jgi:cytochrome c